MSFNYTGYLNSLANLAGTQTTNPFFIIEAPSAIEYAENRIYRDLDLITTIATDSTQVTTASNRNITVPSAFIVVNGINLITPAGTTNPELGKRNILTKMSKEFLDAVWPDVTGAGLPTMYAIVNQGGFVLAPWPNAGFTVEYTGTQRPAPLSASNPTTFLTINLPDLFLIASMIHVSAYQKNWSRVSDDPAMAVTYEAQYKTLLASADAEELRKRYQGTAVLPPPGAAKAPVTPGAAKQ